MKTFSKKIALVLLTVCMVITLFTVIQSSAATNLTEEEFAIKIAQLKDDYPHGKYWSDNNGVVSSGTYKGTSMVGDKKCSNSYYWCNVCGTFAINGTYYAWQCHGYSLLLGHKIFGSNANNWTKYTDKNCQIYAGDVIRIDMDGDSVNDDYDHTIFVYKVTSTEIYYTDCNKIGPCKINWEGKMSISDLRNKLLYVRHLSGNTLTGNGTTSNTLTVHYNANGGYIPNSETITVTESVGIRLRSGAGTDYDSLAVIPQNTVLTVTDIKADSDYVWGHVNYNGTDGWCVISEGWTSRKTNFCVDSSNMLYYTSSYGLVKSNMSAGKSNTDGLYNATTLNLQREGYTFVGWSLSVSGGTILDENIEYKAEDIYPDIVNGNKTVTVYAQWEPICTSHTWITDTVYTAATCTTSGSACNVCSNCGETQDVTLPALGHDTTTHSGKAATCSEKGWNAYVTCSRCSYSTYSEIAALGHNTTSHSGKSATCTEKGWNAYVTCSRCSYSTYSEISALGHSTISHSGKAATCTEKGWNTYETCSRCSYSTYSEIAPVDHIFGNGACIWCGKNTGLIAEDGGYRFYKDGVAQSGWVDTDGDGEKDSYFFTTTRLRCEVDRMLFDGIATRRFYKYNPETGFMEVVDGFYTDENGTQFFKNGLGKYGWITADGENITDKPGITLSGVHYFAYGDGLNFYMVEDETKTIGGVVREFDENHLVKAYTGWATNKTTGNANYYVEGELQQGWFETENGWVYLSRSENLANNITYGDAFYGWRKVGGKVYYFRATTSTPAYVIISDPSRQLTYEGVRSTYYINQTPANGSTLVGSDYYITNPPAGF